MSAAADYPATLDYLYTRLPMFSRIGAAAIKADLTNTIALCDALGNPQRRFPTVHVAGTNGKGSTSHMLAAIFSNAGYKTGLYTSPHLVDFRERIRIDGKPVSEQFVVDFVSAHKPLIERIQPSFFEITVAMAFAAFAAEEVDIAIIETGLGGRLDSTNIIMPVLSIITNISLDHTDLLGKDIASIAREKAGIIKPGVPVVIGEYDAESLPVFVAAADVSQSALVRSWEFGEVRSAETSALAREHRAYNFRRSSDGLKRTLLSDLQGDFQIQNMLTVLTSANELAKAGWNVSLDGTESALQNVKALTGLRGRMDVLQQKPLIIADVAHNPAGLAAVLVQWNRISAAEKHVLLGFVRDKDVSSALQLFPKDAVYHFCAAAIPRALPADELAAIAASAGLSGIIHGSVSKAMEHVTSVLLPDDALLITGSFFIVGEAMTAPGVLSE